MLSFKVELAIYNLAKKARNKDELEKLSKINPELARKKAKEDLVRIGLIDEDGNLKPPYNGQKVNENDFTMGPGEIDYDGEER